MGVFAVITWSYLARLALVFAMQSSMLSNSYEATLFCVGLCVRASTACKMACVQHASHTHEEVHADVVAILKFEGTHNASQISHHNLHLLCHVCRVLVACLGFALLSLTIRVCIMPTYEDCQGPTHHAHGEMLAGGGCCL